MLWLPLPHSGVMAHTYSNSWRIQTIHVYMEFIERYHKLKSWIGWLEEIAKEFPGENTNINTAIKSFKSQLSELEKKL